MNALENPIFLLWIIACYLISLSFSQEGPGKFIVHTVSYIKEVQNQGEIISHLKENPAANTEKKRLKLCRDGFKKIQNQNNSIWNWKWRHASSKGIATEDMKVYIFKEAGDYTTNKIRTMEAYKCSTDPVVFIHVNARDNSLQPIIQVIYQQNLPRPTLERIMYQMIRVEDIVEANEEDMTLASARGRGISMEIPVYDTDELTDDQRLQICLKGMETSPKLNIKLSKDETPSKNKFYIVTTLFHTWNKSQSTQFMVAFECPTQPKIYISLRKDSTNAASVNIWVLIKTTDGSRFITGVEKLGAVSEKTVAQTLYHQTREANEGARIDQVIDSMIQYDMCELNFLGILAQKEVRIETSSNFRNVLPFFYIKYYDEFKNKNPQMCARFYKKEDSVLASGEDVILVNGPESIDVTVSETQENVPEDVFVCLIRTNPGSIEEYFVSKEYRMTVTKVSLDDYPAGRFVFKRNPNNNSVVLIGMIEELAKALSTSIDDVELLYLGRRKEQIGEIDSNNPLCRLDNLEKSRVCTLVFDFIIHKNLKAKPLYHDLGCTKNSITFVTEKGKQEANGNQYFEWMITCYESVPDGRPKTIYYLSQANDNSNSSSSNDVFTYNRTHMSEEIVLENAYTDKRIGILLANK